MQHNNPTSISQAFLSVLLLWIISTSCSTTNEDKNQTLFDPTFDDWTINGDARWENIGDEWIARLDSGNGFVMTKGTFDNFELTLDFYPDSTINSGIYIRCIDPMISATDCYEFNIWDLHPNQENRTGAVVARAQPLKHVETLNQWNSYRITVEGDHLQAWVNDEQTVDLRNADLSSGYIALQASGNGLVKFRNITLSRN